MKKTMLVLGLVSIMATGVYATTNNTLEKNTEVSSYFTPYEINSFCKAIIKGDLEMVKKMIDLGEDVNQKSLGKTPAHYAARYNKPEILELLIANGANLKKKCDKGYTAKKYAQMSKAEEALEVIETTLKK
ncbi:MAG: ankyrin repeat domain-containing protein [Bacteroidota bacterium]